MIDFDKLKKYVKEVHSNHPFVGYDHIQRVHDICLYLAKGSVVDTDILRVAAYLHDIAVPTLGPKDHSTRVAEIIGDLLSEIGVPEDKHQFIYDIIETHTRHSFQEPKSLEAKILRDADGIDYIGAVGIMRCIMRDFQKGTYSGSINTEGLSIIYDLNKTVTGTFNTKKGNKIANSRFKYLESFAEQLKKEITIRNTI